MTSKLYVDQNKCTRCGLCARDCIIHAIVCDKTNGVHFSADGENACIDCQHCMAVCPQSALIIGDASPAECIPLGELPTSETMFNLISQRRSIRHFSPQELPPETMEKLISSLNRSPTGCNHRGLYFFVAGPEQIAAFRNETSKWLKRLIKSGILGLILPRYKRLFSTVLAGDDVVYRNAPHLIIAAVDKKSPCKHADPFIALTQFDLMAQSLGIGTCWCGFAEYAFKLIPKLRKRIGLPRGYKIGAAMLFGMPQVTYPRSTSPAPYPVSKTFSK